MVESTKLRGALGQTQLSMAESSRCSSVVPTLLGERVLAPAGVKVGTYTIAWPLIKPSRLTSKRRGGIGKKLSSGWALNFAVGCTHACAFCYVNSIYMRFGRRRYGSVVNRSWGSYILIPSNMDEAIRKTPWRKWKNEEVLMSSTHDPYLPMLAQTARRILERALASGVKVCIQTRSPLVMNDFDLLTKYKDRIRLQISIATKQSAFSKTIETRVASPEARLNIIRKAKKLGLRTGVILAPIFPPLKARPDLNHDLDSIMEELKSIGPDNIYGECIHIRGRNGSVLGRTLGMNTGGLRAFDLTMKSVFTRKLRNHGLKGTWWPEHTHVRGIGSVSR